MIEVDLENWKVHLKKNKKHNTPTLQNMKLIGSLMDSMFKEGKLKL